MKVYVIGSLRNPRIPEIGKVLRAAGHDAFEDWFAAGEFADSAWQKYEQDRGRTYIEALNGYAARHVFEFDKYHLDRSDAGVLVAPAGKSGHLELGYLIGRGKPGYILLEQEPERWDVMVCFATVCSSTDDLLEALHEYHP